MMSTLIASKADNTYHLKMKYYLSPYLSILDKPEKAIAYFDKSIELNPEFSSAYYQAGLAAVKKGDFKKAIKYFEEFLRVEPDAPETNRVKAMIEELKKTNLSLFYFNNNQLAQLIKTAKAFLLSFARYISVLH